MSNYVVHRFHLVDESPWPLLRAAGAFFFTTGLVNFFFDGDYILLDLRLDLIVLVIIQWWRDISCEATMQGRHTGMVELGMRWGMGLFIISEVFFFFSFF